MVQHIDTVAILFLCYAIFQLSIACFVGGIYGLMGGGVMAIGAIEGEVEALIGGGFFVFISVVLFIIMLLQPVLALLAAMGIRRRTTMGRILGFIVAALAVLNMPIGTVVGIFGFVVLLDKEAAAEFTNDGRAEYFS